MRASMVGDPGYYRCSSYRANGHGQTDPLITPHSLYLGFGADDAKRRAAYRDLFGSALEELPLSELRMAISQDQPVGNDRFYWEIQPMTG